MINIKIEGTEKAIRDIKTTELRKRGQLIKAIALTAIQGEGRMKQMLSQPGSGRLYGSHRASAPGEPPAVDTGQYRASWHHSIDLDGLGGDVSTDQERAPWLEFGTRRMAARPHAGPVSEEMKGDFIQNVKREVGE